MPVLALLCSLKAISVRSRLPLYHPENTFLISYLCGRQIAVNVLVVIASSVTFTLVAGPAIRWTVLQCTVSLVNFSAAVSPAQDQQFGKRY